MISYVGVSFSIKVCLWEKTNKSPNKKQQVRRPQGNISRVLTERPESANSEFCIQ